MLGRQGGAERPLKSQCFVHNEHCVDETDLIYSLPPTVVKDVELSASHCLIMSVGKYRLPLRKKSRSPLCIDVLWLKFKNPMPPVMTNYQHHKGCRGS